MFGLFFKKKKQKPNRDINFICKECGYDCSKCNNPFCYSCFAESGVCIACGADTTKHTPPRITPPQKEK